MFLFPGQPGRHAKGLHDDLASRQKSLRLSASEWTLFSEKKKRFFSSYQHVDTDFCYICYIVYYNYMNDYTYILLYIHIQVKDVGITNHVSTGGNLLNHWLFKFLWDTVLVRCLIAESTNQLLCVPYGMMWCSICTFYPQPCHSLHIGHSTSKPSLHVHKHHTWTSARMMKQCHLKWVCLKDEALDMSINLYTGTIQESIHTVRATMFLCRLNFRRVANFRDVADSTGGKLRSGKLFRSGHFAAALPEAHCWNPEHVGTRGISLVVMDMGYFGLFHVRSWHVKTYCITVEWYCGCCGFDLEIDPHAAMIFISYFAVPVFSRCIYYSNVKVRWAFSLQTRAYTCQFWRYHQHGQVGWPYEHIFEFHLRKCFPHFSL